MKGDLVPVSGCTRCWCGAKYWDPILDGNFEFACVSCGDPFKTWQYALDADGIPQTKDSVELDENHRVW